MKTETIKAVHEAVVADVTQMNNTQHSQSEYITILAAPISYVGLFAKEINKTHEFTDDYNPSSAHRGVSVYGFWLIEVQVLLLLLLVIAISFRREKLSPHYI